MKTLNLFLTLLLFLSFSMQVEAQTTDITTSVIQHDVTNTISIDHSPNGQYTVVAVDGYDDGSGNPFNGYAAVYCNTCTGYTYGHEIATFVLPKGTTGAAATRLFPYSAIVSDNGNVYFHYRDTWSGDIPHYVLRKNGNEIMSFLGNGPIRSKVFNGFLYMFASDGSGGYLLYKIDENTDQVIYSTPVTHAGIGGIILMPNGNIAGKVRFGYPDEGNLYEFDANTGAELGLIRSGNPYGHEKFGDNGDLEVQDNDSQHPGQYMFVYSQSSGWASIIKQTDLPDPNLNLYQQDTQDWEFEGNEFHAISTNMGVLSYQKLSNELVHGFLRPVSFNYEVLNMWFNHDGTYTVVGKDSNGAIHLSLMNNIPDDTSLIPTVHIGGDIVDGRNGQIYDNGWQTVDPHILTMVIDDANIPAIGTTPPASWLNVPAGYVYEGAFPVRDDGYGLVYDAQVYKNGYQWYDKETVRVLIKATSEVAGVQENTLTNFTVYPNPANTFINVSAGKEISQIEILDINGRSVLKQDTTNQTKIFIGDLSPGVYVIRVQAGNQTGTHKWIKL